MSKWAFPLEPFPTIMTSSACYTSWDVMLEVWLFVKTVEKESWRKWTCLVPRIHLPESFFLFFFFSFLFLFLFSFFLFYFFYFLFSPVSVPMCLSVFVSLPSTVSFSISGCLNPAKKSEPIAPQSSGAVWMKVEVVVLGSPSLIDLTASVDVKQHWTRTYCLFRENRDRAVELCEMMTCVELGWTLKKWDSWPQMAW